MVILWHQVNLIKDSRDLASLQVKAYLNKCTLVYQHQGCLKELRALQLWGECHQWLRDQYQEVLLARVRMQCRISILGRHSKCFMHISSSNNKWRTHVSRNYLS